MRRVCELNKLECNVSYHYSDCFNIFQITKPVVKMCVVECVNVSVKYYGSLCVTWNFQKVVNEWKLNAYLWMFMMLKFSYIVNCLCFLNVLASICRCWD